MVTRGYGIARQVSPSADVGGLDSRFAASDISPDGKLIALAMARRAVYVLRELGTGREIRKLSALVRRSLYSSKEDKRFFVVRLAFRPDGRTLAIAGHFDSGSAVVAGEAKLRIWSFAKPQLESLSNPTGKEVIFYSNPFGRLGPRHRTTWNSSGDTLMVSGEH